MQDGTIDWYKSTINAYMKFYNGWQENGLADDLQSMVNATDLERILQNSPVL